MANSLFITSTDTGVGKTFIACRLVEAVRDAGLTVGVLKPFSAGDWADATALVRAAGSHGTPQEATLLYCPRPLAPGAQIGLGARGKTMVERVFSKTTKALRTLQKKHDCVVVEGCGGVLAPLGGPYSVADLMAQLNVPIWVVARAGLGTINHTLLTLEALKGRGLDVKRILLSNPSGRDLSEKTNADLIRRLSNRPVTVIPRSLTTSAKTIVRRILWKAFQSDFL
ncbi:MAG: dethiobiotin synthase [Elusimicrobia bacterium]|nr:dethiobiotin synthase [Elusimicrobiota bacterium]